jgi:hypothetical protein
MNSIPIMKENKPGLVSKILVWLLIPLAGFSATYNILSGNVVRPTAFYLVIGGFILFAIGKLSVIVKKQRVSFGSKLMSQNMTNLYRVGYWLMFFGIIFTFVP